MAALQIRRAGRPVIWTRRRTRSPAMTPWTPKAMSASGRRIRSAIATTARSLSPMVGSVGCAGAAAEVGGGVGPVWERELESGVEQAAGDDSPALQDQLRLGAHEHRAGLEHPAGGGQGESRPDAAEGLPRGVAQVAHELGVGQR